jgi:hypothetical protein
LLYLRLARGYRLADHARLALTTAAAATVAALLLRALGRALTMQYAALHHPAVTQASLARLLWCLPGLAALGYLTAVCVRSIPKHRPERAGGLTATGLGPSRMRLLLATEAAVACAVGALLALAAFVALRGHLLTPLLRHRLAPALGLGNALPPAGLLALLALVPLLGGAAAAASVRAADWRPATPAEDEETRAPSPRYTATACALVVAGAALELGGRHRVGEPGGVMLRLPGFGRIPLLSLLGATAAEIGLALAIPILLHAAGQLLAAREAEAVRLLAGRGLQSECWRLGAPLAVLSLYAGVVGAAGALGRARLGAPFALTQAALICACALGAALARAAEMRVRRAVITQPLREMGVPRRRLAEVVALRTAAAAGVTLAAAGLAAALATAL